MLFFPLVNYADDNVGRPPPLFNVDQLRAEAAGFIDGATGLTAQLDGVPIAGLSATGPYRIRNAPAFSYTYVANSAFCAVGVNACPPYLAGGDTVSPAVSDGIYLMLAPLPVGRHTLHFTGTIPAFGFSLDITYNLTVAP
jgi:hypothetical protein